MILKVAEIIFNNKLILRSSVDALRRNKVRSFLTSIGIIIGVSSVIIMVGIASSARLAVKSRIVNYGSNAMVIGWSQRPMSETDYRNIKTSTPNIQYVAPTVDIEDVRVRSDGITDEIRFICTNNEYFFMRGWTLREGRYFDESEVITAKRVAVIGSAVQDTFFGGYNSIGRIIYVYDQPYEIIGILNETGTSLSGKQVDKIILIPYTTSFTRITGNRNFTGIQLSTFEDDTVDQVQQDVIEYMRKNHKLQPHQKNDFEVISSKDKMKIAETISGILTYLLAGVASISLIVGGVGIMNIMLVSVSERTREIGIRCAVGAKRVHILIQFLTEAIVLSLFGGCIGIVIGIIAYYGIVSVLEWEYIFSFTGVIASFLFAVCTGVFFGYYPARKASKLRPIDALRYE
jgi:putative ABC transport system permease protein